MDKILTVKDLNVANAPVFVRVDFNVPIGNDGKISDDTRIVASLPTIKYLCDQKAKVILASHMGRPKSKSAEYSLLPSAKRLSELLGQEVTLAPDCIGSDVETLVQQMSPGQIIMLENLRFHPAEEKPETDRTFAQSLAKLADFYVNDAFGCAHRAHSSTATIAQYFPGKRAAGFLLEKEIEFMGNALMSASRPFFAIIGGAKISTKIGVLKTLSNKVDALLLGGGMTYTFLKALGISIGDSIVEDSMIDVAKEILQGKAKVYFPIDIVAATKFDNNSPAVTFPIQQGIPAGYQGMDIGEKTVQTWTRLLQDAKTVLWNGPVGVFEMPNFSKGTLGIAKALADLKDCVTIVGGGDTVAAIQEAHLAHTFTHVSTGGGASLEYLEFGTLPGIEALKC